MGQFRNNTEMIKKHDKNNLGAVYKQQRNNIETRWRHYSTTLKTQQEQQRTVYKHYTTSVDFLGTRQKQYRNYVAASSEHHRNTTEAI
jgi:predicted small secreted protein